MTINLNSKILPYVIYFSSFIIATIIVNTIGMIGLIPYLLFIAFFPLDPKPEELNTIPMKNHKQLTSKDNTRLITRASK